MMSSGGGGCGCHWPDSWGSSIGLDSKDFRDLSQRLFFATSQGLNIGIFRLRADAVVSHLKDALELLLHAFGQFKGIGPLAQPLELLSLEWIGLGAVKQPL